MAKRSTSNLPAVQEERTASFSIPVDPVTGLGLVAVVAFAALIGGPLWAGMAVVVAAIVVNLLVRQQRTLAIAEQRQDVMAHHLLRGATPDDIAELMMASEVGDKSLYDFLEAIKHEYGGESSEGDMRQISPNQVDAVSPGITLTLSHDLGHWFAFLHFKGATGKKYLQGGYAQWKARGKTPQEAVENVIRKAAQGRQQVMIQDYAARMVADAD